MIKQLNFHYNIILLFLAAMPTLTLATTVEIPLDPKATFIRAVGVNQIPNGVNLAVLGIAPGDTIRLTGLGDFKGTSSGSDNWLSKIGVFSATDVVLGATNPVRVPGAIDAGDNYMTNPTYVGSYPTDIPEDFFIDDIEIVVPSGALFLLLAVPDTYYQDNTDPDGDLAVRITYITSNVTDISVNAQEAFLRTVHVGLPEPTPIALAVLGIVPGNVIGLDVLGEYLSGSTPKDAMIGLFSATDEINDDSSTIINRVPGAIDSGQDFITATIPGGNTEIDEDFFIDGIRITVPEGALYLIVSAYDSYYLDNSDTDGNFGVRISYPLRNENIDPNNDDNQYAWSQNSGWINFEPTTNPAVFVTAEKLIGYCWGENIGWINLNCENNGTCDSVDYGVVNDGIGNLSGFAWGQNVGWINFNPVVPSDPTDYGVKIAANGAFSGWAWGQNIGWINFGIVDNYVIACKVTVIDFYNFTQDWLEVGDTVAGDLDDNNVVDYSDFAILSLLWQAYCPHDWPLK